MEKLLILACSNISPELKYIVEKHAFVDVSVITLEADCAKPLLSAEDILKIIDSHSITHHENILVIGSVCLKAEDLDSVKGIRFHNMENCFELFLNKNILIDYIAKGYYLISSGWLNHCWDIIEKWGFDETSIKVFFRESAQKLLYLDTGTQAYLPELKKISEYLGLDYEILNVGIDFCNNFVQSHVSQWRYEKERNYLRTNLAKLTRQTADYAMVFDQIGALATVNSEAQIVNSIMDLFNMLFSARTIVYQPYFGTQVGEAIFYQASAYHQTNLSKADLDFSTHGANDILIELWDKDHLLGAFKLLEISFPQYREHYEQVAKFLRSICALSVSHARKYLALQEKEMQLSELNQQKDKLFSVIAHDIKGPVGNFMGLTELMRSNLQISEIDESMDLAVLLHEESVRLNALMNNLLEWSAFQTGNTSFHPDACYFHDVALHVSDYIGGQAQKKNVYFSSEYPPDLVVLADIQMLKTILRNLLANAVKFTHEYGYVKLKATIDEHGMATISVYDTGIGIPIGLQEKLFMPGENVSRTGTSGERSTGLGLLICRDFIQKHGSHLQVDSAENQGTRFSFTLATSNSSM